MLALICKNNAVQPKNVVDAEQQQDAKVKSVPETENVKPEALFGETDDLVEHIANRPEPEDHLQGCDCYTSVVENSNVEAEHDCEGDS